MKLPQSVLLLVISLAVVCHCGLTKSNDFNLFKEMSERNMNMSWFKAMAHIQEKNGHSTDEMDINLEFLEPEEELDDGWTDRDNVFWKDCTSCKDRAEVLSVSFNPDPPEKGSDFAVTTKMQLNEEVEGGKVRVFIKYQGCIPVLKQTWYLCDLASMSGDSCPLATGVHDNVIKDTFPDLSFSGKYVGAVRAWDSNGKELSCIRFRFWL